MSQEHRSHGHEESDHQARSHAAATQPATGIFSRDTDASAGRLLDALILKQLLSLEHSSLAAILEKLRSIDRSNELILEAVRVLDRISAEHATGAQSLSRIESKIADLSGVATSTSEAVARMEAAMTAASEKLALELQSSRLELSASVRAQSETSTETKT